MQRDRTTGAAAGRSLGSPPLPLLVAAVVVAAVLAHAGAARADAPSCWAGPAADRFPTCFDPGTRITLGLGFMGTSATDPVGSDPASAVPGAGAWSGLVGSMAIAVRHLMTTDDPGVWWRLEHVALDARVGRGSLDGVLYRGRYIRHARDGRIVLPTSPPRKLYLPFDLGAEAEVGRIAARGGADRIDVGVVRTGFFGELLRSPTFRRRLELGVAARWDLTGSGSGSDLAITEHRVAPFTLAMAAAHIESATGLTSLDLAAEAGRTWSTERGWENTASASAALERVLLAVNNRPLSLVARAGYDGRGAGGVAWVGLRVGLVAPPGPPR